MCGLVGIVNPAGHAVDQRQLERMAAAIAHRGPDGEGFHRDGCVGLGHRRLAIIDLSERASQPMVSADGRYSLVYNGEVYNFRELRSELVALGRSFRSDSDTEVVLQAWEAWGEDCLPRFNGMFALAVYDRIARTVHLARDRYGIKPLYWMKAGRSLLFASEQKALLAHDQTTRDLDPDGFAEYLTFQNFLGERTLIRGLRLLPPATVARIDLDDDPRPHMSPRYWDFRFATGLVGTREELSEELDRLMRQAVRRQLVSDVEVGVYLSGGVDSGAVSCFAAEALPYIKTFTCGFDLSSASGLELSFDERVKAESMSAAFRTEHYEMVLKSGDMERCLPRLVYHLEEPRIGQSYPNYYTARLAAKFVKVTLSGIGGDELFGGYPWRYYRAAGATNFDQFIGLYSSFWQRLLPSEALGSILAPLGSPRIDVKEAMRAVFSTHDSRLESPEDYINHSLYFEAKTFLHGLLVVEDKLSMAHGMETRVPFLDNDLVDFAMRVPVAYKLDRLGEIERINENEPGPKRAIFLQRTNDGKRILRDVMDRHLPAGIATGDKQGFSAPDASWFKGSSIDFVRKRILDRNAPLYRCLDYGVTQPLIAEHLEGRQNRRLLIWSLLNLNEWLAQLDRRDGMPA